MGKRLTYHNGPGLDLIMATGEEVLKVESLVPISDDLGEGTTPIITMAIKKQH